MNNYKKKPFIPAIQKTSTLVLLSALALLCFTVTVNFKIIEKSSSFDQKVVAASLMLDAMQLLKIIEWKKVFLLILKTIQMKQVW